LGEAGTVARRSGIWAGVGVLALAGMVAWRAGFFDEGSPVSGEVLLGTDDRTLTASVYWTGCEDRPRLVAHESSDAVTLEVVRRRHAPDDAVCDDAQAEQMTVRLAAPLGHRRLGSVGQGAALGIFDARRLRQPGFLPACYVPTTEVGPLATERPDGHFEVPPTPTWQRAYAGSPKATNRVLWITQALGDSIPRSGHTTVVDGHVARLVLETTPQGGRWGETLTWFDGTWTMTVQEQDFGLTQADVLRVAQGLG
jgi:hypothetical protein